MLKRLDDAVMYLGGFVAKNSIPLVLVGSAMVALNKNKKSNDSVALVASLQKVNTLEGIERFERVNLLESRDLTLSLNEDPDPRKAQLHRTAEAIFKGHGLPKGLATTMLRYESRTGDLMVSKTGCLGYYQFCKATAKIYKLTKPHEITASSHAAARLMLDNRRILTKYGVSTKNLNLYLAHMIGAKGLKLMTASIDGKNLSFRNEKTLRKVIRPNWQKSMGGTFGRKKTEVASVQFLEYVTKKFQGFEPTYSYS